jgi:hypothetical protein
VQAVGELDDEDTDVLAHRHDHLAHGLGLRAVAVLELVELRNPIDEHGDLVAEVVPHHVERVLGVLDGVMEQRRGDRLRADAEIGEDLRHRNRVGNVRLAALALLPRVRALRRAVGPLDERDVRFRVMRTHRLEQAIDGTRRLRPREDAGQQRAQCRRARRLRLRHEPSLDSAAQVR